MFNPSTPSEQGYDVKIKVKCVENLIFAKYDVQVYLNDSLKGTIKNGKTFTLSETLQEGHYELKFVNKDDSEITATVKFDIKQDESLEYQITCSVWDISVKTIAGTTYKEKDEQSEKSKIKMTEDSKKYVGNQSAQVKKSFEDKGFTNVKIQQVTTTDSKNANSTVKEVLVNGKGFVKGDTFEKDASIIIYCWKLEQSGESKIEMTQDAEQYVGKQSAQVKKEFEDKGFTSIKVQEVTTTDAQKTDNTVKEVLVNGQGFVKGDTFKKDVEIIIYCWKVEKPISKYEKAFIRNLGQYSLYYMFDVDEKTVVYFGTNDTYPTYGTYKGDFSAGITITWSHGEWTEKFTHKSGSDKATLVDGIWNIKYVISRLLKMN